MFRSLPKRALLSWLLGVLGPPAPPPRRYFSKYRHYDARRLAAAARGSGEGRAGGPGHRAAGVSPAGRAWVADVSRRAERGRPL
jgi:hypothetical protein